MSDDKDAVLSTASMFLRLLRKASNPKSKLLPCREGSANVAHAVVAKKALRPL